MKHQDTISEVITKNLNYAIDATKNALGAEKAKRSRRGKGIRKALSKKTGQGMAFAKRKAKALKKEGIASRKRGTTKVKSVALKAVKKAKGIPRGVANRAKAKAKAKAKSMRKSSAEKPSRKNNVHKLGARKPYVAPSMRAA